MLPTQKFLEARSSNKCMEMMPLAFTGMALNTYIGMTHGNKGTDSQSEMISVALLYFSHLAQHVMTKKHLENIIKKEITDGIAATRTKLIEEIAEAELKLPKLFINKCHALLHYMPLRALTGAFCSLTALHKWNMIEIPSSSVVFGLAAASFFFFSEVQHIFVKKQISSAAIEEITCGIAEGIKKLPNNYGAMNND